MDSKRSISLTASRLQRRSLLAGGIASLATIAVVKAPAKAAQFEFKCGSISPPDQPTSVGQVQMWSAIEKESGGRIRTQFFPNSELGSDAAMLSQLRLGALQFLIIPSGDLAPVVPVADIGYLGFAFRDTDEAIRVSDGTLGNYVRAEVAAKGLYAFQRMWDGGMNQIGSNSHPIATPDDMRGFKVRVAQSKITIDLFKELGASPTPVESSQIYTALQTKLVDGETAPLVSIESHRFFEVNKYISLTNHAWVGNWLLANKDVWQSLPPDLQAIVERNNVKYTALCARASKIGDASVSSHLGRQGMVINKVDPAPFWARLRPYYREWASTLGPTAWGLLESSLGRKIA